MTMNMTTGRPMKHILGFALPLLAGLLFQKLYNMVDTAIVGRLLGSSALAAVGATGSITFLMLGFCMGICSGFVIPVAQYFGANNYGEMRRCVGTAVWAASVIAVVMTAVTMLLCRPILIIMNTPADIIDMAYDYLIVMFASIPAMMLYNLVSGLLRSLGDSRHPLFFLILSSLLNIVLDLLFILTFHWGVAGAAWATLLAQAVSGAASLLFVAFRCPELHLNREELRFRGDICRRLCTYGVPMGLQYSITAVGCAILQVFVNGLGTTAVAAITAAQKFEQITTVLYDALGATMATYCGQNIGAWKIDRLLPGVRDASLIGGIYSLFVLAAMLLFGRQCSMLFLDASETEVISMSAYYLALNAGFHIPLVLVNTLRFAIQGMGYPGLAMVAGVMELIGRTAAGFLLVPALGYTGACLGAPAAWVIADMFLLPACLGCVRRLRRVPEARSGGEG